MTTKLLYHFNDNLTDSSSSALSFSPQSSLTFPTGKFGKGASGFGTNTHNTKMLYHFNNDLLDSSGNKNLTMAGTLIYGSGKFG